MLQLKARERFGSDPGYLYTAEGLEMMTHPLVAERRAARLAALGMRVVDLTCGLGGDLGACVRAGVDACGVERDRVSAMLAAANVPAAGVVQGDGTRAPVAIRRFAVVIDPSRRGARGRRFDPGAFSPPWDVALALAQEARAAVVKGPPGIDMRFVPGEAEIEFVQLGKSLRECAVWLGEVSAPGMRRGVLLPGGDIIDSSEPEVGTTTVAPGRFVFDPESCVTRAGLVRQLGWRLGAQLLDEQVAYLTSEEPAFDALADTFEVMEVVPFSVARLRETLRARGWRADEIRRRAFPVEPDELRRLLGPIEGERVTLLCTTLQGRRTVVVARQVRS